MKYTKTEIDLCEQVAEKYRKPINAGDCVYHKLYKNFFLVIQSTNFRYQLQTERWFNEQAVEDRKENIPLWTIEDCLEFLEEKYPESILIQYIWQIWSVTVSKTPDYRNPSFKYDGKTPLEALLKVILEVLKEDYCLNVNTAWKS